MKKHAIQINTAKDRLNFALHMGANATMLGAAIVYSGYSNYVSYSGQADRIAAALLPSAVAEIGRRLYPYAKAALVGGGDLPEACLRPGERGRFYRRAARQISKRLGIADVPRIYIRSDGSYRVRT